MSDPIIVAHRGLSRHAPENTLAAYRAALDLRCGFEVDIQTSADGELFLFHDRDLARTTAEDGIAADKTLAELRQLDAGAWFDPAFAGQSIPTLEQSLRLASENRHDGMLVALDLKATDPTPVCELLRRYELWDAVIGIGTVITSKEQRRAYKEVDSAFPAARWSLTAEEWDDCCADPDCDWVYTRELPTQPQVSAAERAGKRIFVSGDLVMRNAPEGWSAVRKVGVHALNTDYPLECRRQWRLERSSIVGRPSGA